MTLTKLIKSVIILNLISFLTVACSSSSATATAADTSTVSGFEIPYYGDDFYEAYTDGKAGLDMQWLLRKVLTSVHISKKGKNDLIADSCNGVQGCYAHTHIGYKAARTWIMSVFYTRMTSDRGRVVKDLYCDMERPTDKGIPDYDSVNVEHTWPQSRFNKGEPKDVQKSDLHHLFPTHSRINMIRGSNPFGEVDTDEEALDCQGPRFGLGSAGAQDVFQPPESHRGNVARALFYFSVRYDTKISTSEEAVLRKWHREDPVDEEESERNNQIFELQKNRNPFIDFPDLVDRISDF